jgi:ribosome maturation factor RimP
MKRAILFVFLLAGVVFAQETQPAPGSPAPNRQRGQGEGRGGSFRMGGTAGTITAIKGDTLTVKGLDGIEVKVKVSDTTQFRKEQKEAKLADFKNGDVVLVRGEQGADGVFAAQALISRADLAQMLAQGAGAFRMGSAGGQTGPAQGGAQMQLLAEGMGKQFIAGKVKEINGTKLTIERPDNQVQTIEVDENTSFRLFGDGGAADSVTLADVKPGFNVFGRGALNKDGVFVPTVLNVSEHGMKGMTMAAPRQ